MPWSVVENIPPIANEIQRLNPSTVMDCGVGLGTYGVIARQVLDGIHGRFAPKDWTHKIKGVEIHEPYRNPAWAMYDDVHIGDFAALPIRGYELVMMLDSFEHLEPERGAAFLDGIVQNNRHIIISVPNGPCPQENATHGNEFEKHRATYFPGSFERYGAKVLHLGYCAIFSIKGRG